MNFPITGKEIPVDHGYQLLSAISRVVPIIHNNKFISIHHIAGQMLANGTQNIVHDSLLTIRMPAEFAKEVMALAGKTLSLGRHKILVGIPYPSVIKPASILYSPLVIIKGFTEPQPFLQAVRRQLNGLNISAKPLLIDQPHIVQANNGKKSNYYSPYLRRTITIKDKEIVGFALKIINLNPEESILLQETGLGGRHRFGCGIFKPVRS